MRAAIYIITLLVTPLRAGTPEAMVLLKSNCFSCHNPEKEKGGLDLTSREAIMAGGDNGKVLQPGKAAVSRLVQTLQPGADPHMPPKDQLSPRAIAALETWVNDGAPWDAEALKDRPSPSGSVGFTAAELCAVAGLGHVCRWQASRRESGQSRCGA